MENISVLLVEDDAFTRSTLTSALAQLGFTVPNPAGTVPEAIESFSANHQSVLLVDLDLGPGPSGLDLAALLRKSNPRLGIVFLTSFEDPRLHQQSQLRLPTGAQYLVKQSVLDVSQIAHALRESFRNQNRFLTEQAPPSVGFTDVQLETMRLVAQGLSNQEIAKQRFVTEKAIEKTVRLIADQLNLAPAPMTNVRVAIARAYFKLTGGKG